MPHSNDRSAFPARKAIGAVLLLSAIVLAFIREFETAGILAFVGVVVSMGTDLALMRRRDDDEEKS